MTPADRNGLVERARDLIATEKLSQREAAAKVGIPESSLRYRLAKLGESGGQSATPAMDLEPGEIPVVYRDYSNLDRLHVFPLGDVHKGSPNFQSEKWAEWLEYIEETPETSMLGTGDFLNVALKDSVSDVYAETTPVGDAKWDLADELRPIKDRIDILIPGNHEARIHRAIGDCPIRDVARTLEVPYASAAALIVYRVGEIEYEVYLRHGSGSGRAGAQATRMERESQTVIADVYVTGHTHRQQAVRGAIFCRDGRHVVRRRQLYVSSGSFLSYEDYAARFGLPPADVGCPRIRLDGTRRDPHVSI